MRMLIRIVFVIFIAKGIDCLGGVCDDFCGCLKEKEEKEKKEKEDNENNKENNKENDEDKKEENNEEKNDENNEEKKENEKENEKEDEKKDEGIMEYEEIKNEGNNTAISLVNYDWFSGKKNLVLKIFKKKGNNDFLSKDNGDKISIKLDEKNNPKIFYQKGAEDEPNLGDNKYAFFEINPKVGHTVYLYCSDVESWGNKIDFKGIFSETDHISISVKACDTEKVTDMGYMFSDCRSLKELDLKIFNTKNVTNMRSMFCWCSSLTKLNLQNFNTTKVTDMYSMFTNCSSLKNLDISNFNTTKDLNINYMFYGCKSLEKLNISKFNIENYTNVDIIFKDCNNLPKNKINEILGKKK